MGGGQGSSEGSAAGGTLIDTLTLTADSQTIDDTSDDVTWANELVGLSARAGFDGYGGTPTDTVTVPVDGVLFVNVWASWGSFTGGGQMVLHVTRGSKTFTRNLPGPSGAGQHWHGQAPRIAVKADDVLRVRIEQTSGSGQTLVSATVELTLFHTAVRTVGETLVETMWLDSVNDNPVTSQVVLATSVAYRLEVHGNWRVAHSTYDLGSPDDIIYPSSGGSSGQAGHDPDVLYAHYETTDLPQHYERFELRLDGSTWQHHEPEGGPFSTPDPEHRYTFHVIGQGLPLDAVVDRGQSHSDNNGQLRIDIYEAG